MLRTEDPAVKGATEEHREKPQGRTWGQSKARSPIRSRVTAVTGAWAELPAVHLLALPARGEYSSSPREPAATSHPAACPLLPSFFCGCFVRGVSSTFLVGPVPLQPSCHQAGRCPLGLVPCRLLDHSREQGRDKHQLLEGHLVQRETSSWVMGATGGCQPVHLL